MTNKSVWICAPFLRFRYAALEMLTKEATDILEEIADHWDFAPLKSETGNESDAMKNRMELRQ